MASEYPPKYIHKYQLGATVLQSFKLLSVKNNKLMQYVLKRLYFVAIT